MTARAGGYPLATCLDCFERRTGTRLGAIRNPVVDICAWCGEPTNSGIYTRGNPTHSSDALGAAPRRPRLAEDGE